MNPSEWQSTIRQFELFVRRSPGPQQPITDFSGTIVGWLSVDPKTGHVLDDPPKEIVGQVVSGEGEQKAAQ